MYSCSINKKKDGTYFVSFPVDNQVYQYDSQGSLLERIPVKSNYVPEYIRPYKDGNFFKRLVNKEVSPPDLNDRAKYLWTTSRYTALMKMPGETELFARMASIMPSKEEVEKYWGTGKALGQFSLVFFQNEKVLGEQIFQQEDFSAYAYFLTKDKIYFFNNKSSAQNEDYFYFTGFSLVD